MVDNINLQLQLPIKYILIIICLICILLLWFNYNMKKNNNDYKLSDTFLDKLNKNLINKLSLINQNNINKQLRDRNEQEINNHQFIVKRDNDVMYDVFTAPERRIPEYLYPVNDIKKLINYPSRGYPEHFQLLGIVVRESTETTYNLFGRQTFPKSNQYEYYVQTNLNDNNIKIPIKIHGNKEIENDQIINIIGTDKGKGDFRVKLYDYDIPRYIPY